MTQIRSTTRQVFLQGSVAGVALTSAPFPLWSQTATVPLSDYVTEFFVSAEWAFILNATARLIPSDGEGPGAREARVPVFIDRQLAGDFGQAATWYMEGPDDPGANPDFGWQSPLTPAEIYRESIPLFDAWCERMHGARFADLAPDLQDAALVALEQDAGRAGEGLGPSAGEGEETAEAEAQAAADTSDGVDLAGASGTDASPRILPDEMREFFALLLQNTKEGYFSDPLHGGNHAMLAWVHIGFPGARASFLEWVPRDNVPYRLGPVSIAGDRA